LFGTQTGQAGSGGATPDEPDAAAAATGQPGSRCGSDPSHHETGGLGSRRAVAEAVWSAPIDSWLARIDRPEFSARERTYLTDFGTPRDFPSWFPIWKSDKWRTWRYSRVVSRTPDVSVLGNLSALPPNSRKEVFR
jgi:hypothetical protein